MITTSVQLSDDLLLLLDGKGDEILQKQIDAVKNRRELESLHPETNSKQAKLITEIVSRATTNGRLRFNHKSLTSCGVCGKRAGYLKFKSGPRKGQSNYDRPLYMEGVDLDDSFVTIKGHAGLGCCRECWNAIQPLVIESLSGVGAELPERLMGKPQEFKRYDMRECTKCGWIGSERLMGKKRTIMGDGFYPASCPSCNVENTLFGPTLIKSHEGHEMFRIQPQEAKP